MGSKNSDLIHLIPQQFLLPKQKSLAIFFWVGGNSNMFLMFTPKIGEDEPIFDSYFFKGVGSTTTESCLEKKTPLPFEAGERLVTKCLWLKTWRESEREDPLEASPPLRGSLKQNLSRVQNPGWLYDLGDCTTQLYGDYNKPIKGSL